MADEAKDTETKVVKDPTKKSFWHFRNIILIALTAGLPALTGWVWNKSSDAVTAYLARQKAQDDRLKAIEERIKRDMENLEEERASDKAIWSAISEQKTQMMSQEVDIRVLQKLFDREYPPRRPADPSTTPGPTPAENPPAPVIPPPPPKPVPPDQYKSEKKHLFPNEPQQQKK